MEVRIVEEPKKVEKVEVPFVVGGVYRSPIGVYYMLNEYSHFIVSNVDAPADYVLAIIHSPRGGAGAYAYKEQRCREIIAGFEYVPGAYLAIPKTLD